jgi:hypothetical protein
MSMWRSAWPRARRSHPWPSARWRRAPRKRPGAPSTWSCWTKRRQGVFRDGRPITVRSESALKARFVRAVLEYLDFKPLEELFTRGALAAATRESVGGDGR